MALNIHTWRISGLLIVALLTGCSSTPKEKSEYEKQIDAVPMPTTEEERLVQCQKLGDLRYMEHSEIGQSFSALFKPYDQSRLRALNRRIDLIHCTKAETRSWPFL